MATVGIESPEIVPNTAKEWRGVAGTYFIGGEDGPVKIGYSRDIGRRFRVLQTGYPVRLFLVAVVPGGSEVERQYHRRFAAHHLRGEWFALHSDIMAEIDRLLEIEGL